MENAEVAINSVNIESKTRGMEQAGECQREGGGGRKGPTNQSVLHICITDTDNRVVKDWGQAGIRRRGAMGEHL